MGSKEPGKTRTAGDERFLSSFGQYVDALVDETCSQLKGKKSAPGLARAGRKLVEDSIGLDIAENVETLVSEVDDLAEFKRLAPEKGRVRPTPSGKSIYGVWETLNGLGEYFGKNGLTLHAGVDVVRDRHVIDVCLGEAESIKLSGGPDVVVFTKTLIERTSDTIENKAGDGSSGITTDWTTYDKIYHPLEPKINRGRAVWSRSKGESGKQSLNKIEELAWTGLISESDGRDTFAKKYARVFIGDAYLHEVYHSKISGRENYKGYVEEAAAQLYSMSRGKNPLGGLQAFYEWKDGNFRVGEFKKTAKLAFKYLKKAGYRESLWKKLGPKEPDFDVTVIALREQAENALSMLEKDNKMRDHNKLERELGISRNYARLDLELERIILAK